MLPIELELSAAAVLSLEGEVGRVALAQRPRATSWCSGKLSFIAAVTEPSQVQRILDHLHLNDVPPAPTPRPVATRSRPSDVARGRRCGGSGAALILD